MLHLIWYIIVGSIVGGLVTHMFSRPKPGAQFHPAGIIVSILGALLVLWLWPAGAVALAQIQAPHSRRIIIVGHARSSPHRSG